MNTVLIYNNYPTVVINGSIINAFEYYFAALEHNSNMSLCLINFNRNYLEYLFKIVEDRYYLSDLNWKKNILLLDKNRNLIKHGFDKVLVLDYSTIKFTRYFIRAKNLIVLSEYYTDDPEYIYNKKQYNAKYWGEMPFVYKDYDYRMKMLFNRFKPLKKVKNNLFISFGPIIRKNTDIIEKQDIDENIKNKIKKCGIDQNKNIFFKTDNHVDSFFEEFNEFLYIKRENSFFDTAPRIFVECCFYNKKIHYINDQEIKDGSYYRYNDILKKGYDNRTLTKEDEIIQQLI